MSDINYQNASNITNFQEMIEYANIVSDGWFCVGILLSIFTIVFIATMKEGEGENSFAVAAFVAALFAILLRIMALIPNLVLIISIIIFFVSVFMLYIKGKD